MNPAIETTPPTIEEILAENKRRLAAANAPYDPIAGDASDPTRTELDIPGLADRKLYIPKSMAQTDMVASLMRAGSLDRYIAVEKHASVSDTMRETVRKESPVCAYSTTSPSGQRTSFS